MQIQHTNHILYILTGSLLFLTSGFLVLSFLCPFAVDNSYANTETTTNGDYYIETTTTDLNLTINTTPAGTQETASHDVTVKTDDPAGYTLTVSVNNDTSNALNLNGNTSATEKFSATSGTYDAPKALDENSWGFADTLTKKNNDQWAAVPLLSNAQQIKQTSSASTSGDTTTLHYAINAKYDGQHSNGNYSNTITYSVIGNTVPTPTTIEDNMYMQDVTQEMCTNTEEYATSNKTYTLIDSRDNSDYQVRKLKDGNCWMVQNLRIASETTIANDNSDITDTSWTLPVSSTMLGGSSTEAQMHDNSTSSIHNGNYYNWPAAVAGNIVNSDNAPTSICPKNWKLPIGGYANSGNQFNILYRTYDSNSSFLLATQTTKYWPGYYNSGATYEYNYSSYWWSRTANGSFYAFSFNTDVDGHINLYQNNYKYYGLSVRCVLPAE